MRFWDASAIIPLLVDEGDRLATLETELRADPVQVVWWGTLVECQSAIRRREREGLLTSGQVVEATDLLATLADRWVEVQPADPLRTKAIRLLGVHPLKAADAMQLAAAGVWRGDSPSRTEFVCLDERLADAARREGFRTLPNP